MKMPAKLHIAMYPWVGMGHIIPLIHLSNELAARGHSVSFLLPNKAIRLIQHHSLHPDLIAFHAVTIPSVDGLPLGAEITADVKFVENNALAIAFDAASDQVESLLSALKPDLVFFDFAHWIPDLAKKIGFKTVCYNIISASCVAYGVVPARRIPQDRPMTEEEILRPPEGYPSSTVVLKGEEGQMLSFMTMNYGAVRFDVRVAEAMSRCDAIGIRTCRETEGAMCDYISGQYEKPVLLSGPVLPEPPKAALEERWEKWLSKHERGSVIYCAFGSQIFLPKAQFQEMLLGFEMTGMPFFVAVSKPEGAESIEEALPEGFLERVGDRGVVHGGWVQQTQILTHPSVGCFVAHGGLGSIYEWLSTDAQIVFVPFLGDQFFNVRLMSEDLKVAVEVRRGEKGWFSKEDLSSAVKLVMDEGSEVGRSLRENHGKLKATCGGADFQGNYIDSFIQEMSQLL